MWYNSIMFRAFRAFRAYDVRGKISSHMAERLGMAFVMLTDSEPFAVGRDNLNIDTYKAFKEGAVKAGATVYDLGECSTPMLNWFVRRERRIVNNGVICTASHVKGVQGFKFIVNGLQIHTDEIQRLKELYQGEYSVSGNGRLVEVSYDVFDNYFSLMPKAKRPLKVEFQGVELPFDSKEDWELRAVLDTDCDRCYVYDRNGQVSSDRLMAALSKEYSKRYPGEKIYGDLRFSKAIKCERMRVGNPFFKEALEKEGCMAGELSGHFMFKDHYNIDDGLMTFLKVAELDIPELPHYRSDEISIPTPIEPQEIELDGEKSFMDGMTVEGEDWWVNIRKSNTEDLLRFRVEAKTPELLKEKVAEITNKINEKTKSKS
jgi:phosphomannomutase